MKILSQLSEEERDDISVEDEEKYQEVLIGDCFAMGLTWGKSGSDVFYTILMEDDGHYFTPENSNWNTYWLPHFQALLRETEQYLKNNFISYDCGWKVK